jgi:hypothetical protein
MMKNKNKEIKDILKGEDIVKFIKSLKRRPVWSC